MASKAENKMIFRMSSAGTCPRALSAQYLGYKPEIPTWLETAANEGKWHEERLVQELQEQDKNIVIKDRQLEVKLEYPTFILLGHIDGKVDIWKSTDNIKTRLLEIKSMSQYEFDRWMKDKFNGFQEYADQITCYMEATKLKECQYVVKNRSSGYIDKSVAKSDDIAFGDWTFADRFLVTIGKLETVHHYVSKKELEPTECDMSTLQCKRCFYKYLCVKTKEDMTLQDEKVLLKASEDWRKGKELAAEGKELIDDAKKLFEEHTIASGLKKWQFDDLAIMNITVKEHEVPARLQKESSYIKISDTRKEE